MDETNLNWDDLRLFLAVARAGGLAAAAKSTGKSPPTLGRRMLALETSTGCELFRRLPRGYELTPQGIDFLNRAVEIESRIAPLVEPAGGSRRTLVKISAGTWMTQVLCENARSILGDDSGLVLRFIAADQVLDIGRREAVIGIRNHRPQQVGLACRQVGRVRFAGYAVGNDIRPWVRVMGATPSALWLAANAGEGGCLEVTTPRNALDLARAGVARVLLPMLIGERQSGLVRVTPPVAELDHDQWLVAHHEDRFAPAVRRTVDRIHTLLRTLHRATPTA